MEPVGQHLGGQRLPRAARTGEEGGDPQPAPCPGAEAPLLVNGEAVADLDRDLSEDFGLCLGQHQVLPGGFGMHPLGQTSEWQTGLHAARVPQGGAERLGMGSAVPLEENGHVAAGRLDFGLTQVELRDELIQMAVESAGGVAELAPPELALLLRAGWADLEADHGSSPPRSRLVVGEDDGKPSEIQQSGDRRFAGAIRGIEVVAIHQQAERCEHRLPEPELDEGRELASVGRERVAGKDAQRQSKFGTRGRGQASLVADRPSPDLDHRRFGTWHGGPGCRHPRHHLPL